MTKQDLVEKIIQDEWTMFASVNNVGGKADCQDDKQSFQIMRHAQMTVLPAHVLQSYADDIERAKAQGRNLMTEKYGYMMKYTFPSEFDRIKELLPPVTPEKDLMAVKIAKIFTECTMETYRKYPLLVSQGRPVETKDDMYSIVSSESYFNCELLTLSEDTLSLYLQFAEKERAAGHNIHERILKDTIAAYGFSSLEEAEENLRLAAEKRKAMGLDRIATELCTNCR